MANSPRPTDLGAVLETTTRIIRNIEILTRRWVAEDRNAYAPRGTSDTPGSGTGTGDPTAALADLERKHRDRDRIGTKLHQIDADLIALIRAHEPRTPNRPCRCCRTELATHGPDPDGQPTRCHPCQHHLERRGIPCDDAIHDGRPRIRWCQCPPACCDPCPDHAEEERTLSRRCRQRKARGQWYAAS